MPKVVLYELNEVPWDIVDLYVRERPSSHLARFLADARCETTRNDDPDHLSPWRTWPTFHKGVYVAEHGSYELGQDPETFRGVALWDVAEAEGKKVGLFGPLQSWPARRFAHGGFHVPDTFARTPETEPPSLERFQAFNLSMTNELGFSADARLRPAQVVLAGLDLVRRGLTPRSAARIVGHLVQERRDPRHKASRSILQALPGFDLYWRLHRKVRPDLSVFFTNHVAGMMHRFWGDAVPGYAEEHGYRVDEVWGTFVVQAMDVFDRQLGTIRRWVDAEGDTVLVVAASMGQAGIPYDHIDDTLVLDDPQRLAAALGIGPVEKGLAMYPMNALELPDEVAAVRAGDLLGQVVGDGEPIFDRIRVDGTTVTFGVQTGFEGVQLAEVATFPTADGTPRTGPVADLGLITAKRLGGGNTAYHVPEGIYLTYGPGIAPDPSRRVFDVRQAAPTILGHLGIAAAWPMPVPADA